MGNACSCQDFKTNRLGLCKHISATLHQIGKIRGAKKVLRAGCRPALSQVYVDYRQGPRIRLHIGSENETKMRNWAVKWFDPEEFLSDLGLANFDKVIAEARAIQPGFVCHSDAYDRIAERREGVRRQALLKKQLPKGADDPNLDKLLKAKLFPYQKTGVWFAANAGRCLLADEMGLGKTIQAIAAAELLRRETGIQKAIVVCPTSLKYQ